MNSKKYLLTFGLVLSSIVATYFVTVSTAQQGMQTQASADTEYQIGAILFMQKAAEYRALCLQAFNWGKRSLDDDDKTKKKLPKVQKKMMRAVVVDIDETMLDNSPAQAYGAKNRLAFDLKSWYAWGDMRKAKAIPGSVDFAIYAKSKGVRIFYVSNRDEVQKAATIDNLRNAGFPDISDDNVLLRQKDSTKEPRRLAIAEKYAKFLQQTPWYEFPFGETLKSYWRDTPLLQGSVTRSLERRFALSAEYGVKAIYARLIAQAAALSPAALTLRSVVRGMNGSDTSADVKPIERRGDGLTLIETPRYRTFTKIILTLVGRERSFVEIAGNSEILVTILSKGELSFPNAKTLFQIPLQAREGWVRQGIVLPVGELGALAKHVQRANAEFEHAYDY